MAVLPSDGRHQKHAGCFRRELLPFRGVSFFWLLAEMVIDVCINDVVTILRDIKRYKWRKCFRHIRGKKYVK